MHAPITISDHPNTRLRVMLMGVRASPNVEAHQPPPANPASDELAC